jgi:hypothetical protein
VVSQSSTLFWYVVRGSGFVAYIILTAGVIAGLALSLRWRSGGWPRPLIESLHQYIQLLGLAFLGIHIVTTVLDSFARFRWYEVLIPFIGPYAVFWYGIGIIALYLSLALAISIYVRRLIGYRAWRTLHYAGFAAWILALGHAITTGTDTRSAWAEATYGVTVLAVVVLFALRFSGLPSRATLLSTRRVGILAVLAFGLLLGVVLTAAGPFQRGWAAHTGAPALPTPTPAVPPAYLQLKLEGSAQPYERYDLPSGYQMVTLQLHTTGTFPLTLDYRLLVHPTKAGIRVVRGLFSLTPASQAWNCSGAVTFQPPDRMTSVCQVTPGQSRRLVARVNVQIRGHLSGRLLLSAT